MSKRESANFTLAIFCTCGDGTKLVIVRPDEGYRTLQDAMIASHNLMAVQHAGESQMADGRKIMHVSVENEENDEVAAFWFDNAGTIAMEDY
jgi:hypothetical protein